MKIIRSISTISSLTTRLKKAGKYIGFVPTMGYLHEGHLSLIRKAHQENDIVVVSIFVNPKQFGPKEDYKRYPRGLKRDARLAKSAGCDIIFYPDARSIYPSDYLTYVSVEKLSDIMCGKSRPSHFKGVATVCTKLFNIAKPDIAYFGQKDYQQATIIQRMAQDLNMGLKVKIMPIVREKNGLAMSSRNVYLTPQQKEDAAILYKSLKKAKPLIKKGEHSALKIKALIRNMILEKPQTKIDYIAIKDPKTLKDKKAIDSAILIAIAVWVGKTRLIDNIKVPGTLKGGRRQC